ncbi:unnamed protein product [Paramecium sonneborni]|uniref:Uncharacterized protein n=1 Tax=Paramecium sonneborni TaxID=65129 RepID=A0A8S1RPW5_9CILI|nr:unnamed protein product [Paramecium sonneborni]
MRLKPFNFDLIKQYAIKQNELCCAITFKKDCLVVIAEYQGRLNEHTKSVYTLNFMMNTDNFVSGSSNKLMIRWQVNENIQWICQQKLDEHSNSIFCLMLKNNDDLIKFGSMDYTIKIWKKSNQWFC